MLVIASEHGDPWSHMKLAQVDERQGNLEKALFHYTRAADLFSARGAEKEAAFSTRRRGTVSRSLPIEQVVRVWREEQAARDQQTALAPR